MLCFQFCSLVLILSQERTRVTTAGRSSLSQPPPGTTYRECVYFYFSLKELNYTYHTTEHCTNFFSTETLELASGNKAI